MSSRSECLVEGLDRVTTHFRLDSGKFIKDIAVKSIYPDSDVVLDRRGLVHCWLTYLLKEPRRLGDIFDWGSERRFIYAPDTPAWRDKQIRLSAGVSGYQVRVKVRFVERIPERVWRFGLLTDRAPGEYSSENLLLPDNAGEVEFSTSRTKAHYMYGIAWHWGSAGT